MPSPSLPRAKTAASLTEALRQVSCEHQVRQAVKAGSVAMVDCQAATLRVAAVQRKAPKPR